MDWLSLDLSNIPTNSGVYGFKQGDRWLYVGKAQNLSKRLTKRHVPLQIALQLSSPVDFLYYLSKSPRKLESRLIKKLNPEWNGYTSADYNTSGWGCTVFFDVLDEDLELAIATLVF